MHPSPMFQQMIVPLEPIRALPSTLFLWAIELLLPYSMNIGVVPVHIIDAFECVPAMHAHDLRFFRGRFAAEEGLVGVCKRTDGGQNFHVPWRVAWFVRRDWWGVAYIHLRTVIVAWRRAGRPGIEVVCTCRRDGGRGIERV